MPEDAKHRSRREDKDREKERREKERDHADRHHHRERDRERESSRHHHDRDSGDRERHHKEKDRRERDREREEEKELERARKREERDRGDREREEKELERARRREERERGDREREEEKDAERSRRRDDDREVDRARRREERERDREREEKEAERTRRREEREREAREGEKVKERSKRRELDHDEVEVDRKRRRRHRDGSHEVPVVVVEEEDEEQRKRRHEEEQEAEQRRLDDEMEKRRRRVQEWQERRRLQQEQAAPAGGAASAAPAAKAWTLDGEESDEEEAGAEPSAEASVPTDMEVDPANGDVTHAENGGDDNGEEDIDPLDAFMNSMVLPEVEKLQTSENVADTKKPDVKDVVMSEPAVTNVSGKKSTGRIIQGEDSDLEEEEDNAGEVALEDEDDEEFMKRVKKTKVDKLAIVDHSKIEYPPFRKNFYIEVKEIANMPADEVAAYRQQLELKVHGKDVPKPIRTWVHSGLTVKIRDTIKKCGFERPMPIQAQALPIIMSGRDCIGIAKTGSGKTLAFVLPMLRHVKDQPPVVSGEGPIALVMAPTRELVQQIHSDIKKFAKVLGINCVAVYGGSGVAQQISELKRGTEIVVCTPGRMIDILCTSSGKITNLRRVTFLVMDEADRMFDMGFEPQITRIVQNIRPDRQTVLFSATFPRQVEILARRVLTKPIEIQVGGRSVVNKDITQLVEVRPESERFLRLLELLGEWYEKGKILVFVHTQDKCDQLFKEMVRHGYPCLSLHGAKDQTDRESTISDFKSNVCNLLIATSIAARGLDVKELELVVNFDVPNHYEDYVHRVGRTGRAGRKGFAVTFISPEEEQYAPDLVKAMELSEQVVPADLKALADGFMAKVKEGSVKAHGTGYGGSGFKFNEEEDEVRKAAKKAQAKEYGYEEDKSDSDSDEEGIRKAGIEIPQQAIAAAAFAAAQAAISKAVNAAASQPLLTNGSVGVLPTPVIPGLTPIAAPAVPVPNTDAVAKALEAARNLPQNLVRIQNGKNTDHYEAELEVNDFPQNARWKITHKETLGPISEWTGAAITTRGQYYPPGKVLGPGERKLYLFIEGPNELSVKKAKAELKRVLEDCANQALNLPANTQLGKYSVI